MEVYQYGIQNWTGVFGIMTAPLFGAYITGPLFARIKASSVFDYFKMRYGHNSVRLCAICCYLVRNFLAMSIFIYGPATSLSSMTNLSNTSSILLIGCITTFYTAIGGIKGVIWTDVFQTLIMFVGLVAVIGKGVYDVDGLANMWRINERGGRLNFFVFDLNPFIRQSNWSNFFGPLVFFSITYGIDQQMLQRFMAAKSETKAQRAILYNIPGIFCLISLCSLTGLVIYANFALCDPLSIPHLSKVSNPNQLVSYFIKAKLGMIPGAAGLFLSAIFSASLSTVSSLLSSQAAILWNDVLRVMPYFQEMSDSRSLRITKLLVFLCGAICTLFAFTISTLGGNIFQISLGLLGAFGTPIIGVFVLSYFSRRASSIGALAGILSGFLFVLWISLGAYMVKPQYPKLVTATVGCNATSHDFSHFNVTTSLREVERSGEALTVFGFNKIYTVSFSLIPVMGFLVTVLVGFLVSLFTAKCDAAKNGPHLKDTHIYNENNNNNNFKLTFR